MSTRYMSRKHGGGVELQLYPFLTMSLDLSGWSTPRLCSFTPSKQNRYPLYMRLIRTQGRDSVPIGIRSPNYQPASNDPDLPVSDYNQNRSNFFSWLPAVADKLSTLRTLDQGH
jgi:hypothetical protein